MQPTPTFAEALKAQAAQAARAAGAKVDEPSADALELARKLREDDAALLRAFGVEVPR